QLSGELRASVRLPLPAALLQRRVRLRNVARERDEQSDGVLGGRDDRRLRRVRDEDAAQRRRVHVDVVDADSRATDDLQPDRALEHVGGELRRRADDDGVVPVDDLVQVAVSVDVDVEARAQELYTGVGNRLANEDSHARLAAQATDVCSYASSAAVTATPRSMSAPSSASTSSIAASAVVMSNTSNQPMWPMRTIFPFRSA